MTLNDFIFRMQIGEEIEVCLNNRIYFLQPDYGKKNNNWGKCNPPYPFTRIYDATEDYYGAKLIFTGKTEDVLNYLFEGKYTFIKDFDKFEF